ncbi:hypothetical protein I7I53_03569 [Histoplasma capsulatum var. duboisii H88]|uniref:Uncharacterized protein n=1 Tax=Ajellomyces capsulatus (strain H88) TaxID=544711 RepID=A0A8A1LSV0_AJEC8|nr:hypothetical protein I7I53_03569 [Histoplasma capsulatum var. duboisii H88]
MHLVLKTTPPAGAGAGTHILLGHWDPGSRETCGMTETEIDQLVAAIQRPLDRRSTETSSNRKKGVVVSCYHRDPSVQQIKGIHLEHAAGRLFNRHKTIYISEYLTTTRLEVWC